jgi:hypothetical protein
VGELTLDGDGKTEPFEAFVSSWAEDNVAPESETVVSVVAAVGVARVVDCVAVVLVVVVVAVVVVVMVVVVVVVAAVVDVVVGGTVRVVVVVVVVGDGVNVVVVVVVTGNVVVVAAVAVHADKLHAHCGKLAKQFWRQSIRQKTRTSPQKNKSYQAICIIRSLQITEKRRRESQIGNGARIMRRTKL